MSDIRVKIANMALSLLGADSSIESLDEETHNARMCKLWLEQARDGLLRAHPWKFATATAQVFADYDADKHWFEGDKVVYSDTVYVSLQSENKGNTPDSSPDWWEATDDLILEYVEPGIYAKPSDCIRVQHLDNHHSPFKVRGDRILVSGSVSKLTYTKKHDDLSDADPLFLRALSYLLAIDLAPTISRSSKRQSELEQHYRTIILPEATSMDAFESNGDKIIANEWEFARL